MIRLLNHVLLLNALVQDYLPCRKSVMTLAAYIGVGHLRPGYNSQHQLYREVVIKLLRCLYRRLPYFYATRSTVYPLSSRSSSTLPLP